MWAKEPDIRWGAYGRHLVNTVERSVLDDTESDKGIKGTSLSWRLTLIYDRYLSCS